MKRIQLEIKALSPLAIGRQKPGGSVSEAEDYIPGTVIRGAIASQILKQSGYRSTDLSKNGGDFQALFLGEAAAIFQNAYPATITIEKQTIVQSEIRVLPDTALSSKTSSGFKTQPDPRTKKYKNGIFDTVIDRLCAEYFGRIYEPNCPVDGGRVDAVSNKFYSQFKGKYYSHSANKRLLTRVGINRRRSTAEEKILYSIEVLNESELKGKNPKPAIYSGAILVHDGELGDRLAQFINEHKEDFRLGGSVSRGLGKVKVTAKVTDIERQVTSQVEQFDAKLKKRWQEWKDTFGNPQKELPLEKTYFTIDLQSDAILTDSWRRTTVILEAMLKHYAALEDSSLKLHAAYSSYEYRSGWNAAWGLMKDMELITKKGATYLFSTTQKNACIESLNKRESMGVGERTAEGFGQVKVCHDFHLVLWDNPV